MTTYVRPDSVCGSFEDERAEQAGAVDLSLNAIDDDRHCLAEIQCLLRAGRADRRCAADAWAPLSAISGPTWDEDIDLRRVTYPPVLEPVARYLRSETQLRERGREGPEPVCDRPDIPCSTATASSSPSAAPAPPTGTPPTP